MSKYIYGIHDIEGAQIIQGNGYVLATEGIGHDPTDIGSKDYRDLAYGATVIARLNNGYGTAGTIPRPDFYPQFAQRVQNFVDNSKGCNIWQIGNEPNHPQERPDGEWITADNYALCYSICRTAIHEIPGHENDIVCIAAIAPWYVNFSVPRGEWMQYFQDVIHFGMMYGGIDGITIHTYTHGGNPDLVFSDEKMNVPFDEFYYHFWAYRDFMRYIPQELQHMPVYITETDQNGAWVDTNSGWVKNAYAEINEWNQGGNQQIRCVCLYRWPHYDQYGIEENQGVIKDLQDAQQESYTWREDMTETFIDSFEDGFYEYQGISELTCPIDWLPVWVQGTEPGVNHRVEIKPKQTPQPEIYHGDWAVSVHTRNATHNGGIFRQFSVPVNAEINVSVMGMIKGMDNGHGVTIGIDPTGGTDILSENILWGDWWSQYMTDFVEGAWRKISCLAFAENQTITVFLRSQADFAGDGMHAHFDLFEMEAEKGTEPPEPPQGDNILDDMLLTIAAMEIQLSSLRGMVEYLQDNTLTCVPVSVL